MLRSQLQANLTTTYTNFCNFFDQLPPTDWDRPLGEKWNSSQQVAHLLLSVKPVKQALRLPKWILRWKFGQANRPSRSYDQLVTRYQERLGPGKKAPERFAPQPSSQAERAQKLLALQKKIKLLAKALNGYSEKQLDEMILPHPLLGKLTLREMIYFTIYHAEHHLLIAQKNLMENPLATR